MVFVAHCRISKYAGRMQPDLNLQQLYAQVRHARFCTRTAGLAHSVVSGATKPLLLQTALATIKKDVSVPEGAPGGMGAYRTALAASFLFKFLVKTSLLLAKGSEKATENGANGNNGHALPEQFAWIGDDERSAVSEAEQVVPKGVQFHAEAKPNKIVGQSERHRAAHLQACCHSFSTAFVAGSGNGHH